MRLSADWVVLSACNTATGNGEGESLSVLASAFLSAGALQVMASHWPVRDDVTPYLTSETLRLASGDTAGGPGRARGPGQAGTRPGPSRAVRNFFFGGDFFEKVVIFKKTVVFSKTSICSSKSPPG